MTANDYMNAIKRVADNGTMDNLVGCGMTIGTLAINDTDISVTDYNKIKMYYITLSDKKVEEMQNEQK